MVIASLIMLLALLFTNLKAAITVLTRCTVSDSSRRDYNLEMIGVIHQTEEASSPVTANPSPHRA